MLRKLCNGQKTPTVQNSMLYWIYILLLLYFVKVITSIYCLCYIFVKVITRGNDQVYLTYHPKICQTDQTSTYVTSPGVIAYLVDRCK